MVSNCSILDQEEEAPQTLGLCCYPAEAAVREAWLLETGPSPGRSQVLVGAPLPESGVWLWLSEGLLCLLQAG